MFPRVRFGLGSRQRGFDAAANVMFQPCDADETDGPALSCSPLQNAPNATLDRSLLSPVAARRTHWGSVPRALSQRRSLVEAAFRFDSSPNCRLLLLLVSPILLPIL